MAILEAGPRLGGPAGATVEEITRPISLQTFPVLVLSDDEEPVRKNGGGERVSKHGPKKYRGGLVGGKWMA